MSLKDQLRVMVVDDTSVSRMLVVDALQLIGLKNIALAKDGVQCLQGHADQPGASGDLRPQHARSRRHRSPADDPQLPRRRATRPSSCVTGRTDRAILERAKTFGLNDYIADRSPWRR